MGLGSEIRKAREAKQAAGDKSYSLRQLAGRVGVEPSYLSKVEREEEKSPSESLVKALAKELGEDPDVMLALAGKVSEDLRAIITRRPALFAETLRQMRDLPDDAIVRVVREVRDGNW